MAFFHIFFLEVSNSVLMLAIWFLLYSVLLNRSLVYHSFYLNIRTTFPLSIHVSTCVENVCYSMLFSFKSVRLTKLDICAHMHIGSILHVKEKRLNPFCCTSANSPKPDQTPQNEASDQVLHCLLTELSFKI